MTDTPSTQGGAQGGGQSQGAPSAQTATAQGDVKQMRVDDLINLANQQNLNVDALNDLISKVQVDPNISAANVDASKGGGA